MLASKDRGDGFVVADLDMDVLRLEKEQRIRRTKYDFYKQLSLSTHRWNPIHFFAQTCSSYPKGDVFYSSAVQAGAQQQQDIDKRLESAVETVKKECDGGSRFVVMPELYLSGIVSSYDEAMANSILANEVNSRFNTLTDICKNNEAYIIIGGIEEKDKELYNTAWLIGPEGVLGSYHKVHLSNRDKSWAKPGGSLFVYDLPIGRIGIVIGEELAIPEFPRVNSIRGVEILAVPAAIDEEYVKDFDLVNSNRVVHWHLARVRAVENNYYTVFSNYCDRGYIGGSGIFGPDSTSIEQDQAVIEDKDKPRSVCLSIDTKNNDSQFPTNRVKAKQLLNLREPNWYNELWL